MYVLNEEEINPVFQNDSQIFMVSQWWQQDCGTSWELGQACLLTCCLVGADELYVRQTVPLTPGPNEKIFFKWVHMSTRLVLGQWLSHLLNMRHKLYQPEKPISNNISVVSSKIPKDQEVNLKPKLGLFDLHIWQRETVALAEQDGGSYIWHRSKQIHENNIQEERLR